MKDKVTISPKLIEISDKVNAIENKGDKLTKIIIGGTVFFFLLPFVLTIAFVVAKNHALESLAMDSMLLIFVWAAVIFKILIPKHKALKAQADEIYKSEFVSTLFEQFFDNPHYNSRAGLSKEAFEEMDLFETKHGIDTEDYLRGTYQGIDFEQSDAVIWAESINNDKRKRFFKGRVFAFQMPCKEVQSVKLFRKSAFLPNYGVYDKKSAVELESMEFNNNYRVYSPNPEDAFYVLTPSMMERMNRIVELYGTYKQKLSGSVAKTDLDCEIGIHFVGNKLYVAISNGMKAFERSTFPLNYEKEYEKFKVDVKIIQDLIEELKLIDAANNN